MPQPTSGEPVNVISAMSGWSTIALPTVPPPPVTTLRCPAGRPHSSSRIRASVIADSGVWLAGFSTTGQPAAIAGASLWATRLSGKLNGLIAPTTPIGIRSVNASLPSPAALASIGTISPASVRAATAANVNVETARWASTRAVLIGLAASVAMIAGELLGALRRRSARRGRGSRRASTRAAARRRARPWRRAPRRRPARRRTRAPGRGARRRTARGPRSTRRW